MFILATIYISNIDLFIINSNDKNVEEIVQRAQPILNTWHVVLKILGGDLKYSKSS